MKSSDFFKGLFQGKRRSFLSVGAICFLAFIMIVGLGFIQNKDIPTFSDPVKSEKTGLDVFHEAARSIADPPDASRELQSASDPKIKKIIAQADAESLSKKNQPQNTPVSPAPSPAPASPEKASPSPAPAPLIAAPPAPQPDKAASPKEAPPAAYPTASLPASQSHAPEASPAPQTAQSETNAKNGAASKKKASILDTPWPPSPDKRAPHVESTFFKRVAVMLVVLGVVCLLMWIVLKAAMPFISKFTGSAVSSKNRLNIVERKAFGPNKSLMLLEVDGRNILIGVTDERITSLSEWPCPEPQSLSSEDAGAARGEETASEALSGSSDNAEETKDKPNLVKEVLQKHLAALPVPRFHKNEK